jgi:hypothetical protein
MSQHILENPTILRYLDIGECCNFIRLVEESNFFEVFPELCLDKVIDDINKVELMDIKLYYLHLLKYMNQETWDTIVPQITNNRSLYIQPLNTIGDKKSKSIGPGSIIPTNTDSSQPIVRLSSLSFDAPVLKKDTIKEIPDEFAVYITTKDAYTLNDGPTIFITNEIEKVSQFYIMKSNIPSVVINDISSKIDFNEGILARIDVLEKSLDDINTKRLKSNTETTKMEKRMNQESTDQVSKNVGTEKITSELNSLSSALKNINLPEKYIPNKPAHINQWIGDIRLNYTPFTSDIDEEIIEKIMKLSIEPVWKLLLLMGIGVFSNKHNSDEYTEIMKMLADNQRLYLIIASSDYIYGTNYQFCNCYISKNMKLTQEKVIQAIGRVGRNNLQQNYSIRFRSDEHIKQLFYPENIKQESLNMNSLFQRD